MNKSYLITNWSMNKCRKARSRNLTEALNDFKESEYIFIHEDGKCIFDGYPKEFSISKYVS